ncbi:MAG: hypothetical protein KatS3mg053_2644 [Candidatus Roseilinea sp.]|nr:MAG: hypothetical protein KatS3mg053_2644 [Candidatus Roseilinea sp.]
MAQKPFTERAFNAALASPAYNQRHMTQSALPRWTQRNWFYPLVYFLLLFVAFLPLITERPYNPQDTPAVIFGILSRATVPYAAWGWVFHVATLLVVGLAAWNPKVGSRVVPAYFGLNYLVVAVTQTHAETPAYGYAIHTGALIAEVGLGLLWLWVAWRGRLHMSFGAVPRWRWLLLPLALLAFWSPMRIEGTRAMPDFNPLLLLTSPDYGLAYCFLTPVFLFLLILAWPQVDCFAFRVTAFNALLYAVFNLNHWASPDRIWLGVMHAPLLVMAVVALGMTHFTNSASRLHTNNRTSRVANSAGLPI